MLEAVFVFLFAVAVAAVFLGAAAAGQVYVWLAPTSAPLAVVACILTGVAAYALSWWIFRFLFFSGRR